MADAREHASLRSLAVAWFLDSILSTSLKLVEMTHENFDRQMEFMLQQQAEHAGRMQQLEELVVRLARTTRDRFEGTDQRLDDVDGRIAALVDSQIRTEENIKKTEENVKKTDEALRRLITTLEGRNGNS